MQKDEFALQEPVHRHALRVLYGDTDAGGVVYYANYLRFCEAGRTELMRAQVVSYRSLEEQGVILPVVDCRVRYKASARYDDLLTVETSLVEVKAVSCRFNYRLSNEQGRLLALAYTTHAAVDRSGKLTRLPPEILAGLQKLAATP
ncbi:acyl-CoA thioesterase [Desulfurivibrio alkaliphilus]|uniref:Thioesterase superfamily protein n=1 Tax=Desulfurivibrio alkaliphilus (strain DSM 19089 / UNIQEM U267 / AHT2) TaxID=589865 RepID=D6Z212_DESAT|nr:thioesterase family protein [Desulfurivibrio alkaliphilus]ADH85587.1 thioesterase superfamily protein [Desulfurivibrio alkaliphilus AHT 2]